MSNTIIFYNTPDGSNKVYGVLQNETACYQSLMMHTISLEYSKVHIIKEMGTNNNN